MHHRSKSSRYSKPVRKFIVNSPGACPCPCDDCKRRNKARTNKFVVNPRRDMSQHIADELTKATAPIIANIPKMLASALKAGARGDDGDRGQIIADLISNDASPFTPDDETALRNLPDKTLREMARKFLKANSHTQPVANRSGSTAAVEAMSNAGLAGADFHARAAERKRMSDAYIRRNPVQRAQRAAVTNSNDPAVQAMSAGGLLAHFGGK